ncbi:MAG TPA: serine protease [Terriglobales bacterium]|nr:serine protease [Terriglobales bacterium]
MPSVSRLRWLLAIMLLSSANPWLCGKDREPISSIQIAKDDSSAVVQLTYWGESGHHPDAFNVDGTGFLIGREGYFITAAHVLTRYKEGTAQLTATIHQRDRSGSGMWFDVVEVDKEHDLALCKISGFSVMEEPKGGPRRRESFRDVTSLAISENSAVAGEPIAIIGFPLGAVASPVIQVGNIGATDAMLDAVPIFPAGRRDLLIVSVSANHGNSGCPVISLLTGHVLGMIVQYVPAPLLPAANIQQQSGLMVAVPAKWISDMLTRHKVANRPIEAKEHLVM